ncbi:MAG: hypothetical protein JWM09_508 [Francisellaceae bacterium]|nr:hypothetical protein [Francisellaceae bacterium]
MNKVNNFSNLVKQGVEEGLFHSPKGATDALPDQVFEQYKMLIDSANKSDDRRGGTNSFFTTINGIFVPYLINTFPLGNHSNGKLVVLFILIGVGLIISSEWLSIIKANKKLNYINYTAIKAFEQKLHSKVFSLKSDLLAEHTELPKANVLLAKEAIIPKLFIGIYVVYLGLSCLAIWYKF